MSMDKTYDPHAIEQDLYQKWQDAGHFKPTGDKGHYAIVIPPPNVTGSLHMGHGFQLSLMDALIRYQRMQGNKTLWQVGVDHAGIATQMVVERNLLKAGQTRQQVGREQFIDKVWQWKAESGDRISQQLRRIGASVDWSKERFTMDEDFSKTVRDIFVHLYDEGIIYRGTRLVNWDPKLKTAVSDLEVIQEEEQGKLWHIRYPLVDSDESIVIATTRPETLLGDVAVAVHPEDPRYQHLVGRRVALPIAKREIPIIADEYVEQDFGSGCVKITPAHDFNDYDMGKRHQLAHINILNDDASLNDKVPADYQGLDRFAARQKILNDLKELSLLVEVKDHTLTVPRGDRSGEILEPFLTDQWYVNAKALAGPAIDAVKSGEIKFVPENWSNTYYQWMENIQDWCISRQLWWGHRIPAWYDDQGQIYVADNEQAARDKYQLSAGTILHQDDDVLDTWFSSALWPFVTLGWPHDKETFAQFYPTNVLVTGFDIIFFWVARMIMMGLKFTGKVPFKEVYITGLIRDYDGQKMSKSKGNVIDPLDIIDGIDLDSLVKKRTASMLQDSYIQKVTKQTQQQFPNGINAYGTDALRYTYCALATPGRNIRFDMGRVEGYRNFCNKIWNAARFVFMNTQDYATQLRDDSTLEYTVADRWITARLQQTIRQSEQYFKDYRFDLLTQSLYDFIWNEYCDWYVELAKPILYSDELCDNLKNGTRRTLLRVLEQALRLIHPIMPFISETIWQTCAKLLAIAGDSIMVQAYPQVQSELLDTQAIADIDWLKQVIIAVRNIRGEMNISPGKRIPLLLAKGDDKDRQRSQQQYNLLTTLAKCDSITWLNDNDDKPASATALVGELELLIPMADLIDKSAELSRLAKEIDKLTTQINRCQSKLANPNYVAKAPAAVVEQERERLAEFQQSIAKLESQYQHIEALK